MSDVKDYIGTANHTALGIPCQRWDSQEPHSHDYTHPDLFPEANISDAHNFCRKLDREQPWCYTTSDHTTWDYCDIPICGGCHSVHNTKTK